MARKKSILHEDAPGDQEALQVDGQPSGIELGTGIDNSAPGQEIDSLAAWEQQRTPEEEAAFEAAMQKWRAWEEHKPEKVRRLRRDASATWKAMAGWQNVETEEQWRDIAQDAFEQYRVGNFLLDQLGAQRYLDPTLFATLWMLRDGIIQDMAAENPIEYMLIDLMLIGYYNTLRVQGWMGNLALETEREFYGDSGPTARFKKRNARSGYDSQADGLYIEHRLDYANHQLLPLLDRCNRMMIRRNMRALMELRRGPAPVVSIGKAGQVNVANQQVNRQNLDANADANQGS